MTKPTQMIKQWILDRLCPESSYYICNCLFWMRDEDEEPLCSLNRYSAKIKMNGYAILPREEYDIILEYAYKAGYVEPAKIKQSM